MVEAFSKEHQHYTVEDFDKDAADRATARKENDSVSIGDTKPTEPTRRVIRPNQLPTNRGVDATKLESTWRSRR